MTKRMMMLLALLLIASPMLFRPRRLATRLPNGHWVPIAAGFSMAIASGLSAAWRRARLWPARPKPWRANPGAAARTSVSPCCSVWC